MRLFVCGDWHGNVKHAVNMINKAGELKIQHIIVVGDFGLWTHRMDGHIFLDEIQDAARVNNLSIYAIGGNHENWDHWENIVETMPTHKGFALVRSRVLLAPKVHTWLWAGKKFGGAGGAVSIDKDWRLSQEKQPHTLWWPNEQFTEQDLIKFQTEVGKVDYLFTHDCSNYTPFHGRLKPDPESERHRARMDKVIKTAEPKFHLHGHMHTKYDWVNAYPYGYSAFNNTDWDGPETRTIGLECDGDRDSWGVLDVVEGTWLWPKEVSASVERRKAAKEGFVVTKSAV